MATDLFGNRIGDPMTAGRDRVGEQLESLHKIATDRITDLAKRDSTAWKEAVDIARAGVADKPFFDAVTENYENRAIAEDRIREFAYRNPVLAGWMASHPAGALGIGERDKGGIDALKEFDDAIHNRVFDPRLRNIDPADYIDIDRDRAKAEVARRRAEEEYAISTSGMSNVAPTDWVALEKQIFDAMQADRERQAREIGEVSRGEVTGFTKRIFDYDATDLPIVGAMMKAAARIDVWKAASTLEDNPNDAIAQDVIQRYIIDNAITENTVTDWAGMTAEGLIALPGFFGVLGLTKPIQLIAEKGAFRWLSKVVRGTVEKAIASSNAMRMNFASRLAVSGGATLFAEAVRTPFAFTSEIMESWMRRTIPQYSIKRDEFGKLKAFVTGEGENKWSAAYYSYLDSFVSAASERAGGSLSKLAGVLKKGVGLTGRNITEMGFRRLVIQKVFGRMPSPSVQSVLKRLTPKQFHGMVGELFEEEVEHYARYYVGLDKDWSATTADEWLSRILVLGTPMGLASTIRFATSVPSSTLKARARSVQAQINRLKFLGSTAAALEISKKDPQSAVEMGDDMASGAHGGIGYIDLDMVEKYAKENNLDAKELVKEWTNDPDAYDRAVKGSGKIAVTEARYAFKGHGKHSRFLQTEWRSEPDSNNAREIDAEIGTFTIDGTLDVGARGPLHGVEDAASKVTPDTAIGALDFLSEIKHGSILKTDDGRVLTADRRGGVVKLFESGIELSKYEAVNAVMTARVEATPQSRNREMLERHREEVEILTNEIYKQMRDNIPPGSTEITDDMMRKASIMMASSLVTMTIRSKLYQGTLMEQVRQFTANHGWFRFRVGNKVGRMNIGALLQKDNFGGFKYDPKSIRGRIGEERLAIDKHPEGKESASMSWSDKDEDELKKREEPPDITVDEASTIMRDSLDKAIADTVGPVKEMLQKLAKLGRPMTPRDGNFLLRSLSQSRRARYWYEISARGMSELVKGATREELIVFFNILSATSSQADPTMNLERALSAFSEYLAGIPIETGLINNKSVGHAVSGTDLEGSKIKSFADTFAYLLGWSGEAPLSVNDRQVAAQFGLRADDIGRFKPLYEVLSRFYIELRDRINARLPEGAEKFETWQLQAMGWVQIRSDTRGAPEDDYVQVTPKILGRVSEELANAGEIDKELLLKESTREAISPSRTRFINSLIKTSEINETNTPDGIEINRILNDALNVGDEKAVRDFLKTSDNVLREFGNRRGKDESPASTFASKIVGKAVEITRVALGYGTYEGRLNRNIRLPMHDLQVEPVKRQNGKFYVGEVAFEDWLKAAEYSQKKYDLDRRAYLAQIGKAWKQSAMADSIFVDIDENTPKPDNKTIFESYSVFVRGSDEIETEKIIAFGKAVGKDVNVRQVPNGIVIDINPAGSALEKTKEEVSVEVVRIFGTETNIKPVIALSDFITEDEYDRVIEEWRTQSAVDQFAPILAKGREDQSTDTFTIESCRKFLLAPKLRDERGLPHSEEYVLDGIPVEGARTGRAGGVFVPNLTLEYRRAIRIKEEFLEHLKTIDRQLGYIAGIHDRFITALKDDWAPKAVNRAAKIRNGASQSFEQRAFHGSGWASIIRQLLTRFIGSGTGEGNIRWGWGLYFSSLEEIAERYRDTYSETFQVLYQGKDTEKLADKSTPRGTAMEYLNRYKGLDFARKRIRQDMDALDLIITRSRSKEAREGNKARYEILRKAEGILIRDITHGDVQVKASGHVYEVEIPDDDMLLHLNDTLDKQPERVKQALARLPEYMQIVRFGTLPTNVATAQGKRLKYGEDNSSKITGEEFYNMLAGTNGYESYDVCREPYELASRMLMIAGIPGATYGGQFTRAKNFVMYDDATVRIESFEQGGAKGMIDLGEGLMDVTVFESGDPSTLVHEGSHGWLHQIFALAELPNIGNDIIEMRARIRDWWISNKSSILSDAKKLHLEVAENVDNKWVVGTTTFKTKKEADKFIAQRRSYIIAEINGSGESILRVLANRFNGETATLAEQMIRTAMHEQFARAGEAYLLSGKAPSERMRGVFASFGRWLIKLYKTIKNLGVNLSPEIRDVFDRLLATDEEIEAYRSSTAKSLMEDWTRYGLSAAMASRLAEAINNARATAEDIVRSDVIRPYLNKFDKEWRDRRAQVRDVVEKEMMLNRTQQLVYRLRSNTEPDGTELKSPPFRLDVDELDEFLGGSAERMSHIPDGVYQVGGMSLSDAADLLGEANVGTLIFKLYDAKTLDEAIEEETDNRMYALHGDPMDEGSIPEHVVNAYMNENQIKLLELEMELLAKHEWSLFKKVVKRVTFGTMPDIKLMRERAKAYIAQQSVDTIMGHREGNRTVRGLDHQLKARIGQLAKMAFKAWQDGDLQAAFDLRREQINATLMHMEAQRTRDELIKLKRQMRRTASIDIEKSGNRLEPAMIYAARYILHAWGISSGSSKAEIDAYLEQMAQYDPNIAKFISAEISNAVANAERYGDTTVEKARLLAETVAMLHKLAIEAKLVTIANNKISIDQAHEELMSVMDKNDQESKKINGTRTPLEATGSFLRHAGATLSRLEHWVRYMDRRDINGPFHKYLWKPIKDATLRYRAKKAEIHLKIADALKSVTPTLNKGPIDCNRDGEIGITFAGKANLLTAILHTANMSSMRKLLVGFEWGELDEDDNLDTSKWDKTIERLIADKILTKEDFDVVQKILDILDSLRPEAQRVQKELYGKYFQEIKPKPIQNSLGTWKGGYFPARIDRKFSKGQGVSIEDKSLDIDDYLWNFPTVERGWTMRRNEKFFRPLLLDIGMVASHADVVLRFTELMPVVKGVQRLWAGKSEFKDRLNSLHPELVRGVITPWLWRVAHQRIERSFRGPEIVRYFETAARWMKRGTARIKMFANFVSAAKQLPGIAAGFKIVKARHMAFGIRMAITSPRKAFDIMISKSPFMKFLVTRQAIDAFEVMRDATVNPTKMQKFDAFITNHEYFAQNITQNLVNIAIWIGKYNEYIEEHGEASEQSAIDAADEAVSITQGPQLPETVSTAESGSPILRMFTQFISYFTNMLNLQYFESASDIREVGLKKGAAKLAFTYFVTMAVPIAMEIAIMSMARGGTDDPDEDGIWDDLLSDFLGGHLMQLTQGVPFVGSSIRYGASKLLEGATSDLLPESKWDDIVAHMMPYRPDNVFDAPAFSVFESALGTSKAIFKTIRGEDLSSSNVRSIFDLISIMTRLPLAPIGRAAGYAQTVRTGGEDSSGPIDYARGLLTGYRRAQ